jgi:hypothetical protein
MPLSSTAEADNWTAVFPSKFSGQYRNGNDVRRAFLATKVRRNFADEAARAVSS